MSDDSGKVSRLAQRMISDLSSLLHNLVEEASFSEERQLLASRVAQRLSSLMRDVGESSDASFLDIAVDLMDMALQLKALSRLGADCPVVQPSESWIPLLLRRGRGEGKRPSSIAVHRSGETMPLPFALASPEHATQLMVPQLSRFLAFRWLSGRSTAGNVEVHNKAAGWDILYRPPHLMVRNGFGGPSTPVSSHLDPGNYHFAITNGTATIWDSTIWPIPPHPSAPIPHKVHVPLP